MAIAPLQPDAGPTGREYQRWIDRGETDPVLLDLARRFDELLVELDAACTAGDTDLVLELVPIADAAGCAISAYWSQRQQEKSAD